MTVTHGLKYLNGQPRLAGRDVIIAAVVVRVANQGVEGFCKSYAVSRREVEGALRYCMQEACVSSFASFCNGCRKNPLYSKRESGKSFWCLAREAYCKEFNDEK